MRFSRSKSNNIYGEEYSDNKIQRIIISFISIVASMSCVTCSKYTYGFERQGNLEIIFLSDTNISDSSLENFNECLEFVVFYNIETILSEKVVEVSYRRDRFISFELINCIFDSHTLENSFGKIECNFELFYFLKLTNDISDIPDKVESNTFQSLLMVLKYLKAKEGKNQIKFLQFLIFKTLFCRYNVEYDRTNSDVLELFNSNFWSQIGFDIMKDTMVAFLNNIMVKYVFKGGNCILLEKANDFYDVSLFDEHIPYKNLMINNCKIFCIIENILRDSNTLIFFEIILDGINMRSLVLNNSIGFDFPDMGFSFFILSIKTFKSVTVSNFARSPSQFFNKISLVLRNEIEFLSFINVVIRKETLDLFLKKQPLKGLSLTITDMEIDTHFIDDYTYSIDALEYINFRILCICPNWWTRFFSTENARIIKLVLYNNLAQECFVNGIVKVRTQQKTLYLDVSFASFANLNVFCKYLKHFIHLKTLKLYRFKIDAVCEKGFVKSLRKMDALEHLALRHYAFRTKIYNFIFQKQGIKILRLENITQKQEILNIGSIYNHQSLTELFLMNFKIDIEGLAEIFNLLNLKVLSLESCIIEYNIKLKFREFRSKSIESLFLRKSRIGTPENIILLSSLNKLENLDISGTQVLPGYLSRLSQMCNITLKRLLCTFCVLNSSDLNRMKDLEALEELNLAGCEFSGCNFWKFLGGYCNFSNSLVILNLFQIKTNYKELKYLRNFKNMKNLSLSVAGYEMLAEKNYLRFLPIKEFSTAKRFRSANSTEAYKYIYLYEENINIDYLYL
ncbi:hypothetical protein CWI36_0356p0010 [Hamiltosporidium magnivora]|uniref:Leucine-rich repeat-containing protein n=1 Tax=Hamiltosporidium magnivora TaxID=148818 RepID=A0A4Q9LG33_9MICR|nr:hypothetical protein CWI36_0356p0010 [Hamiltosporidium magnivora]